MDTWPIHITNLSDTGGAAKLFALQFCFRVLVPVRMHDCDYNYHGKCVILLAVVIKLLGFTISMIA